ncbi:DUF6365 family protein [Virgibacillus soli]|uniref:DUF6365 family protein n=1 Tax=Paracerasibacillus soli TaxID=480284 RepID=A0ABU5CTJ9_9BACI|nr:DUF6365 family protein [Virgibacillus soli]MDY0409182.1 DUF6365 family protein [Virgibacillus soli]
MKVLFIAPSQYSIGELHNAIYLAKQLVSEGVQCHFLTSEKFIHYTKHAGMEATSLTRQVKQRRVVDACVTHFQPNLIILADYHILEIEPPLVDLDHMIGFDIPIATIDSLCFATESPTLYNKLFEPTSHQKEKSRMKYETRIRKIPNEIKVIRTCPINHPVQADDNIITVTLYTEPFSIDAQIKKEIRSTFACKDEDKLIMLSKAAWANMYVKMRRLEAGVHMDSSYSYENIIQKFMVNYLGVKELPSKVVIVGIAPEDNFIHSTENDRIQFKPMPFLDLAAYEELLFSCDLFITDNITSCSMAKAIFGYVPVLSLQNSQLTTNEQGEVSIPHHWEVNRKSFIPIMEKWQTILSTKVYPFITFPNGWVKELAPLLTDNPWMEVVETAEIFNIQETGMKIHDLLYCERTKAAVYEQQKRYIQAVTEVPQAMEMVNKIIEKREEICDESQSRVAKTIR